MLVLTAALAACSSQTSVPPPTTGAPATNAPAGTASTTPPTTAPPPPPCPAAPGRPAGAGLTVERLGGTDAVAAAVAVSERTFECASEVIVASTGDLDQAALAARLAAAIGAPLLLGDAESRPELDRELARLAPSVVTVVGSAVVTAPDGAEAVLLAEAGGRLEAELATDSAAAVTLPAPAGPMTVARTWEAISTGAPLRPAAGTGPRPGGADDAIRLVATTGEQAAPVYVADVARPAQGLVAAVAAAATGGRLLLVDGADLRSSDVAAAAVRASGGWLRLVGPITADAEWQLDAIASGAELPGGGLLLFPGRRLVALYGHPTTPALGVLGEQGPTGAVERAGELAAGYDADGVAVVPSFELIATVASAKAGEDGDYSYETPLEDLRPWVDAAADAGMYVVLDLQPGREDYLGQAMLYEELLTEPHVGLAIDPEWNLGPNQFHLRQIGRVEAAEVNQVAGWLAGLVRRHHLPQKLLLVHQFNLDMIRNRSELAAPPELALVIQMDGQGPLHSKYETWGALRESTDGAPWLWGWKNFFDEDSPTATAAQVLALDPAPVFVSYQ